jgi:hypothetical protein
MNHNLHREGAKDAKKDKSKRENAVFRNKISFSSFFSSSLRPSRLRGANFLTLQHAQEGAGGSLPVPSSSRL